MTATNGVREKPKKLIDLTACLVGMRPFGSEDPLELQARLRRWAQFQGVDYDQLPDDVRLFLYHGFVARGEEERVMKGSNGGA